MREPANPPTIGRLKAMGCEGVFVTCRDCRRSESVPFDVIALPDETLFPNIAKLRRFRCGGASASGERGGCGSRAALVTPDWRIISGRKTFSR
ncbi:MAG: hypothetical protein P4L81_00100, partial [Candidatus Pacebacteria bacterium]|nr:hypothetical protein [Candidatus Paceibacterota bacterium]